MDIHANRSDFFATLNLQVGTSRFTESTASRVEARAWADALRKAADKIDPDKEGTRL